jgi:hypothetical protein
MFPNEAEPIILDFVRGLGYTIDFGPLVRGGSLIIYSVYKENKTIAEIAVGSNAIAVSSISIPDRGLARIPLADPDCLAKVEKQLAIYLEISRMRDEQIESLAAKITYGHMPKKP